MSEVARNVAEETIAPPQRQEYWKPIEVRRETAETCNTCGTDFPIGARFCYVCGSDRDGAEAAPRSGVASRLGRALDLAQLKAACGLPVGSLIAFFVGILCVVLAATAGFVLTVTTTLDWYGLQYYRLEWLLAAIAAFAAGMLLKK